MWVRLCVFVRACIHEVGGMQCMWRLMVLSVGKCMLCCCVCMRYMACVDVFMCEGCSVYGGP